MDQIPIPLPTSHGDCHRSEREEERLKFFFFMKVLNFEVFLRIVSLTL